MVLFVSHPAKSANEIAKHLLTQSIVSDTYRFGIKPLYELPIFSTYKSSCPNAEQILQQIITIPTHEGLSKDDLQRIVTILTKMS
jgi:dTDP-4-amino-4,6-dideoxygalactose transaminase